MRPNAYILRAAGLSAALCLLLAGCGADTQAPSAPPESAPPVQCGTEASSMPSAAVPGVSEETPVYTNLSGETAKAEVFARLTAAGVPQEDADAVSAWVDDFNAVMKNCPGFTLEPEFAPLQGPAVDYGDYYDMNTAWFKTGGRDDYDPLCRAAAYRLLRQLIQVERPIPEEAWQRGEDQWLCSDWDVLSSYALMDLDEGDFARYFTLWDPVDVPDGAAEDEIWAAVQKQWEEYGVSFTSERVSLMTIWRQSSGGKGPACAAHAAVLIEDEDGYLLFEKTNSESPYQATRFPAAAFLGQIKDYMLDSLAFDLEKDGIDPGVCVVMRSGELL